jgi:hypothetical protein
VIGSVPVPVPIPLPIPLPTPLPTPLPELPGVLVVAGVHGLVSLPLFVGFEGELRGVLDPGCVPVVLERVPVVPVVLGVPVVPVVADEPELDGRSVVEPLVVVDSGTVPRATVEPLP